jgi:CBS domain-containing protein
MKLFEAMNKNVITVKKEVTILDVMRLMREKEIGFIIVEEDNEAVGVITDRDIVLSLSREISLTTPINKIMKKYVITASEETELEKATDIMGYMQIRRLVVVNNENKIVGILSTTDLLSNPLTENLALDTLIEISYNFPTKCEETEGLLQTNVFIL